MTTKESAFFFLFLLVLILFSPVMSYTEHTALAAKTVAVLFHFLLCVCIFPHPK